MGPHPPTVTRSQLIGSTRSRMPPTLDAHPLVREYYRHQLREHQPEAWRAGHARLFKHLQDAIGEEYPATMEDVVAAVCGGDSWMPCGPSPRSAVPVSPPHPTRGDQQFQHRAARGFGGDLAAVAQFFVGNVVHSGARECRLTTCSFCCMLAASVSALWAGSFEAAAPLQQALELAQQPRRLD